MSIKLYYSARRESVDIMLVCTCWMQKRNACLEENIEVKLQRASSSYQDAIGVDRSEEMKTWLRDQYFTMVGGVQPAFEAWLGRMAPILH